MIIFGCPAANSAACLIVPGKLTTAILHSGPRQGGYEQNANFLKRISYVCLATICHNHITKPQLH